jgi:hypothetical protein
MEENQFPLVPHVAVIQIAYEVYEQQPNGHFHPNKKTDGKRVIVLRGSDYAVCMNRVTNFLDEVQKDYQNAEVESQGEGPGESSVAGVGGTQPQRPQVFGVRNGFAGRVGGTS